MAKDINKEKIEEMLEDKNVQAEDILKDVSKTQDVITNVLAKMKTVKFKPLTHMFSDIRSMIGLVTDTITKKYTGTPYKTLIAITGALIYFLSPVDVIPDFIPVLGYIDDTFVIALVLQQFKTDLEVYKAWKKPKEEIMIELKKSNDEAFEKERIAKEKENLKKK